MSFKIHKFVDGVDLIMANATGAIVIGLAAVIIGEVLLGKIFRNFALRLFTAVVGGIVYYVIITVVLKLGMNANDLKLFSALIVALFFWYSLA